MSLSGHKVSAVILSTKLNIILMADSLYSEVKGSGQNVVMLHGWGMHGGLWGKFKENLSKNCRTHVIDLPGFGYSKNVITEYSLDSVSETIEAYIKNIEHPVTLLGWSLGGLITLNILKRQNVKLNKVILIASTPCFTNKTGWDDAMEKAVFSGFSIDLQRDYKKTLKRFMLLQTRNSELSGLEVGQLMKNLNTRGEPDLKALEMGLTILSEADLRGSQFYDIPAMIILGEKDTLVPVSVKDEFGKIFPDSNLMLLKNTGHAPFISNPKDCAENIKKFLNG